MLLLSMTLTAWAGTEWQTVTPPGKTELRQLVVYAEQVAGHSLRARVPVPAFPEVSADFACPRMIHVQDFLWVVGTVFEQSGMTGTWLGEMFLVTGAATEAGPPLRVDCADATLGTVALAGLLPPEVHWHEAHNPDALWLVGTPAQIEAAKIELAAADRGEVGGVLSPVDAALGAEVTFATHHTEMTLKSGTQPVYPPGEEDLGAVRCRVLVEVDPTGRVAEAQVQACPALFHTAIQEALATWQFEPYLNEGQARRVQFWQVLDLAPPRP